MGAHPERKAGRSQRCGPKGASNRRNPKHTSCKSHYDGRIYKRERGRRRRRRRRRRRLTFTQTTALGGQVKPRFDSGLQDRRSLPCLFTRCGSSEQSEHTSVQLMQTFRVNFFVRFPPPYSPFLNICEFTPTHWKQRLKRGLAEV